MTLTVEITTLWFLLILVQGHGPIGQGFGSKEACEEVRAEMITNEDVLAASECTPLQVIPIDHKAPVEKS